MEMNVGDKIFVTTKSGNDVMVTVLEPQPQYNCVVVLDGKMHVHVVPINRTKKEIMKQGKLF